MLGVNKLGDEQGRGTMGNGNTETDEESRGDEHLDVNTNRLQNDTENHNNTTDSDTGATTKTIGNIGSDSESNNRTDRHHGVQQTASGRTGIIESWNTPG